MRTGLWSGLLVLLAIPAAAQEDGLTGGPTVSDYGQGLLGEPGAGSQTPSGSGAQDSSAASAVPASVSDTGQGTRQGGYGASALIGHYLNDEELVDPVPVDSSLFGSSTLINTSSPSGFSDLDPADYAPFDGEIEELSQGDEEEWGWIDNVQMAADGIGVADPTGIVDGLNALVYLGRGKWSDAGLTAMGIIPYIGDTAKAGKYAAKGAKVVGKTGQLASKLFKSRRAAFRGLRRDLGIPLTQKPFRIDRVPMTRNGKQVLDANGKPIMTREYHFSRTVNGRKETVVIQEHSAGHKFGQGGVGDQGPHFNPRPVDATGNTIRNGKVPDVAEHYNF